MEKKIGKAEKEGKSWGKGKREKGKKRAKLTPN